jgi:hypothetical protein
MRPGAQVQVLATAYDRHGDPVEAQLTWLSTNINVATVDSSGMVYAVAPGLAIITAASEESGTRRRTGRTTVFVSHGGTAPSDGKTLTAADTTPPPECDDMEFALRNPGRLCWNVRPTLRASSVLAPPASCPTPTGPIVFQVRVSADGSVQESRVAAPANCEDYRRMATGLLADVCCRPAYRNGRPVAAWTIIVFRPPTQPRTFLIPMPPAMPTPPVPATPTRPPRTPAPGKQAPRP